MIYSKCFREIVVIFTNTHLPQPSPSQAIEGHLLIRHGAFRKNRPGGSLGSRECGEMEDRKTPMKARKVDLGCHKLSTGSLKVGDEIERIE
jgi:hypothetical protein